MASYTLERPSVFPNGTVVKAYPATNWPAPGTPSGAPAGTSTAEATVAADKATISGLTENVAYWAVAEVGGVYRYIAFMIASPPASEFASKSEVEEKASKAEVTAKASKTEVETEKSEREAQRPREDVLVAAEGFTGQNFTRDVNAGNQTMATKKGRGALIGLRKGEVITNLWYMQTVKAETVTTIRLGLYKADGTLVAKTGNVKAKGEAVGVAGGALEAPYTVTATGGYYIGIIIVATTPGSVMVGSSGTPGDSGQANTGGAVQAYSDTTEREEPATIASIASLASSARIWVAWS